VRKRIKGMTGATKVALGVVVGLLAGGAVVYAHDGDTSKIHACVDFTNTSVPNVRILGAPNTSGVFAGSPDSPCGSGEQVDWSTTGPAGPQGPAGPAGPAGESATVHTVRKQIGPSKAIVKTGRASCAKGQHVVMGGYSLPGNIAGVNIKESRPSGSTAWYGRALQGKGNAAWALVVYAVCST
jgi:hypothetical protein